MTARVAIRSRPSRFLTSLPLLLLLVYPLPLSSATAADSAAQTALQEGRIGDAVSLLRASLAQADTPEAHLLLCRSYLAEDLFEEAVQQCEAATATPSSIAFTWLGRAYGARAGRANPLLAFALARKVHAAFERAVELDPRSIPALNDLGEFSVKAPAIVGGDLDRAHALAVQAATVSSATEHRLLGLIARKNKDLATAEREYLAGVATASAAERANANINLAQFYLASHQTDPAVNAVRAAIAADPAHTNTLVDAASILSDLHREPDLAIRSLREYVVSPARSDAAPAFKARLQLADLLVASGDRAGAARERAAALALAPDFIPARRLSDAASQSQQVR